MNVVDAIGWTLLHFLWQGLLIGGLYAALRARCRTPHARYALGLVALALCALAPAATLGCLWPAQVSAVPIQLLPVRFVGAIGSTGSEPWQRVDVVLPWLVAFWCIGIALLAARSIREWLRLTHARKHAVRVNAWSDRIETLAQRFGVHRCVDLLATAAVEAPTLLGVFKPAILLPTALLLRLPPAQLELILAHELCHVRRWDYLVNLTQVVLETLLFYHPVVHWLSARVRADRELCCDRAVLATMGTPARSYAQALAELAATASHLAPAANGGVLVERIEILLAAPRTRRAPGAWVPLLSVAAVLLLAFGMKHALEPAPLGDVPGAKLVPVSGSVTAAAHQLVASRHVVEAPRSIVPGKNDASVADVATSVNSRATNEKRAAGKRDDVSARLKSTALAERNVVEAQANVADHAEKPLARRIGNEATRVPVADLVDRSVSFVTAPVASSPRPAPTDASANQPDSATPVPAGQASSRSETGQPDALVPRVTHFVAPAYPVGLDVTRGRVDLQFRIASDGSVQNVAVLAGDDHPQLARAAVSALRQWRFAPGSGQPGHLYRQAIDFDQPVGTESCRVPTGSHICRNDLGEAVGVTVGTR